VRPSCYRDNNNCIEIGTGDKTGFNEKTLVEGNIFAPHINHFDEVYLQNLSF